MSVNNAFLTAIAKISVLILFLTTAAFLPLGRYLISLPCFAIKVAGLGFLASGTFSLWHFLRLLVR